MPPVKFVLYVPISAAQVVGVTILQSVLAEPELEKEIFVDVFEKFVIRSI